MTEREEFSRLLRSEFDPILEIPEQQADELYRHYALLVRWNRVLNLTRIGQMEEAVIRHYCESLFLGAHLPPGAASVLDVGSGAGFPGIPIAVLRPDCAVTLAESHQRKAVFLREATRCLKNVEVRAARANQAFGAFDWVVTRAVRWEEVIPLARRGLALLLGEQDARLAREVPDFVWREVLRLPWGRARVLLLGQRETAGGRST